MTPAQIKILMGYVLAVLYVVLAIGIALVAYKLGLSKKYTRKIVHILVGAEWLILSYFMGPSYHFLIVCVTFTMALALSYFKKLLPAMSSDSENDPGTVYYGLSMTILSAIALFIPDIMLPFGIGVFCTSVGDGVAGIVGQLIRSNNPRVYRNKTLYGTLANLVSSFLVAYSFKHIFYMSLSIWQCLFIAILSAGLELVGAYGLDNLYVSVGIAFFTFALIYLPDTHLYVIPIITAPYIVALVLEKKALTSFGLIMALILDFVVSFVFQNFGFLVLISFFVGALIVDKIKKRRVKVDDITLKEGTRDLIQVIANGLIPLVMAVMYSYTLHPAFLIAYVATLAEAFADTAASGFGVFSKNTYDIFKLRKCECGMSGGVSLVGTLAGLVGAGILSLYLMIFDWKLALLSTATAFLGVIFDSFLGSLFQIKFRCNACGKLTEKHNHCEKPTTQVAGFAFFDNDVVNLLSGAFTATLTVLISFIII